MTGVKTEFIDTLIAAFNLLTDDEKIKINNLAKTIYLKSKPVKENSKPMEVHSSTNNSTTMETVRGIKNSLLSFAKMKI